jgi:4a-hydroxytetrahydrobiopterin dehydratase
MAMGFNRSRQIPHSMWVTLLTILSFGIPHITHPYAFALPRRLTPTEVNTNMRNLPTWQTDGQQLSCTYKFPDFVQAVAFVNRLVTPAETLKHHPDLTITYNQVNIRLSTHDAGGLTDLDFQLAQAIAKLQSGQPGCTTK